MRKVYLLRLISIHGRAHALHSPARIIAQDPDSQIGRLFQPDAAVAEIPSGLREKFMLRSIVKVHVVVIRKDEFHESERVLRPRLLPDEQLARAELLDHVACDCSGSDDLLAAVHNFVSLLLQVVGIASDVRKEFSSCDGIGNTPVRPEYDILHGVAKYRGIVAIGFADHDIHRHSDLEVFVVSAEAKLGNIRDDGRLLISEGQPAPPLESQLHLPHPAGKRYVQICQCLRADSSVWVTPKPALKILHRGQKWTLIAPSIGSNSGVSRKVAHQPQ